MSSATPAAARATTPSAPSLSPTSCWHQGVVRYHHNDCGMETFTDEVMRALLRQSLDTAELGPDGWKDVGKGPGSAEGDSIDWLTIKDQAESVTADVARIRAHPLVPAGVHIYGYIYDVNPGRLIEVPDAMEAAKA